MRKWNGVVIDLAALAASTTDDAGIKLFQIRGLGDAGSGQTGQALLPYGFFSTPLDPQRDPLGKIRASTAATGLVVWQGDDPWIMPLWDPQTLARIPHQTPGSVGLACWTGAYDVFDGVKGSKYTYVPYAYDGIPVATANGIDPRGTAKKSMSTEINVDTPGQESYAIVHGEGMAITMVAGGKKSLTLKNAAGDAYIEINDDGIILNAKTVKVNGALVAGNVASAQSVVLADALDALLDALNLNFKGAGSIPIPEPAWSALKALISAKNTKAS